MFTDHPPRGFEESEFERRTGQAQLLMAQGRLGALLLTTEPEVRHFSGFLTRFWQSPTRPWFLVVPPQGKPVAVIPGIGAPLMGRTWIDDIRTWESPCPEDEGVTLLAATLREVCPADRRIGVPMGPETVLRMPLADHARLVSELPGHGFADATSIVRSLRMVKSEAEVAKIARICEAANGMFDHFPDFFVSHRPLHSLLGGITTHLVTYGADEVPYRLRRLLPRRLRRRDLPARGPGAQAGRPAHGRCRRRARRLLLRLRPQLRHRGRG